MSASSKKILLIHPDIQWLKQTRDFLRTEGFMTFATRSLGIALELQAHHRPEVILFALNLGRTNGQEVISALHHQDAHAVLVVLVDEKEKSRLSELAPGSFFDGIVTPCEGKILLSHLREAQVFYKEKNPLFQYMQEYQDRVQDQLEWLIWKEQNKHAYKVKYSRALISNIRNTILQGMGLGSLITRMELLEMKMKKEDGFYIVPRKDFDGILTSVHNVHRWLENMEKINKALDLNYSVETIEPSAFPDIVVKAVHAVEKFRAIKNHKIEMGDLTIERAISGNADALGLCIRELLINAFKFSPEGSTIDIVRFESPRVVLVGLLNDILSMGGGVTGIPEGYENQIYEPFYKLNNVYDERFFDEDFSMGTGLTIVQGAMQQMGGRVFLHEISDHSGEEGRRRRIMAELVIKKSVPAE